MTDPRMTPTNDAPVTVEQAAARLHRAVDLLVWTRSNRKAGLPDANEMWAELEAALHSHRLAALPSARAESNLQKMQIASAPAGDGDLRRTEAGPDCTCASRYYDSESPSAHQGHCATVARPHDPARLDMAKRLFWADVNLGENADRIQDEWRERWWTECSTMPLSGPGFLRKWFALADVSLARPRAAVGEREA